jgi:hypothetical protein
MIQENNCGGYDAIRIRGTVKDIVSENRIIADVYQKNHRQAQRDRQKIEQVFSERQIVNPGNCAKIKIGKGADGKGYRNILMDQISEMNNESRMQQPEVPDNKGQTEVCSRKVEVEQGLFFISDL